MFKKLLLWKILNVYKSRENSMLRHVNHYLVSIIINTRLIYFNSILLLSYLQTGLFWSQSHTSRNIIYKYFSLCSLFDALLSFLLFNSETESSVTDLAVPLSRWDVNSLIFHLLISWVRADSRWATRFLILLLFLKNKNLFIFIINIYLL